MSLSPASLPTQSPLDLAARAESRSRSPDGQLYLRFRIVTKRGDRTLAIPMVSVQEVLSLPVQRLSPMPNMPSPMLGLMNRGNRIFWLVDLGLLLGESRLEPNLQQHSVMILRSGVAALGLAVRQVEAMQWVKHEQLRLPPPDLPSHLAPYVSGAVHPEATPADLAQPAGAAAATSPPAMTAARPLVETTLEAASSQPTALLVLNADAILQASALQA